MKLTLAALGLTLLAAIVVEAMLAERAWRQFWRERAEGRMLV